MADNSQDERISKRPTASSERGSRLSSERAITEDREIGDTERLVEKLAILRDVNTKLPSPPEIPGYHLCWLTTTNQSDPLEHRFRLGYTLVKPEELPGFSMQSQQGASAVAGDRITVNEMVLAKIEKDTFIHYMKHLHHDLPLEQVESLNESVSITKDGRGRDIAYTGGEFRNSKTEGYSAPRTARPASFTGVL